MKNTVTKSTMLIALLFLVSDFAVAQNYDPNDPESVCQEANRRAQDGLYASSGALATLAWLTLADTFGAAAEVSGGLLVAAGGTAASGFIIGVAGDGICDLLTTSEEEAVIAWLSGNGFGSAADAIYYLTGVMTQGYNPWGYQGPFNPFHNPQDPCGDGGTLNCMSGVNVSNNFNAFGDSMRFAISMANVHGGSSFSWFQSTSGLNYQRNNSVYQTWNSGPLQPANGSIGF